MSVPKPRNRNQVDPSILDKLTDGFTDPLDAIVQLVENEEDWGAQNVTLRFVTTPDGIPCLTIIGDGLGMGQKGRDAYTTVCGSLAKGQEGKKGRNGTGRLGFIHHAAMAVVYEKSAGDRPHRIELTRENMFDAWFGSGPELTWEKLARVPADVPLGTTGVVTTWYNYGAGPGVSRRNRKPERVIADLANKLSPHVARKVTVEVWNGGKLVESHKLRERKIEGKPIEGEYHRIPCIGDIRYFLYVVANPDKGNDQLMIGALGPICEWSVLSGMFRRDPRYAEFMRGIEPVLGHPKVVGLLDIPMLNDYAVNNRKTLNANLLEDEERCLAILGWLRKHLVALVEKELGMRAEEIFTTDDTTLLAGICHDFQSATGLKPEKGTVVADIDLNRVRVDLEPGMKYTFVIRKPKEGVRYAWDATDFRGTTDTNVGTRVTCTARDLGRQTIVIREMMTDASKEPVATITVNVVAKLALGFTKPSITMSTNDRRVLSLQNTHNTSGDLEWTFEKGWGCAPQVSDDLEECVIVSGETEGTWDVIVRDRTDPENTVAVCTVVVKEGSNEKPEQRRGADSTFVYDGHTFELLGNSMTGDAPEAMGSTSWMEVGKTVSVITFNFGHAMLAGMKDEGRSALVRREVYLRVAQHFNPSAQPPAIMKAAAIVGAKLARK